MGHSADETRGSNHWKCAVKGEGVVDTSSFGVPVTTVSPDDPAALERAFAPMAGEK